MDPALSPQVAQESRMGSLLWGDRVNSLYSGFTGGCMLYTAHLIIYSKALSKLLHKDIILSYVSYGFTIIYLAVFYLCYIPYVAKTNAAINSLYMYHFTHA